jgi:hypothetical protein
MLDNVGKHQDQRLSNKVFFIIKFYTLPEHITLKFLNDFFKTLRRPMWCLFFLTFCLKCRCLKWFFVGPMIWLFFWIYVGVENGFFVSPILRHFVPTFWLHVGLRKWHYIGQTWCHLFMNLSRSGCDPKYC